MHCVLSIIQFPGSAQLTPWLASEGMTVKPGFHKANYDHDKDQF